LRSCAAFSPVSKARWFRFVRFVAFRRRASGSLPAAGRFSIPVALALRPDFPGRAGRPFFLILWLSPYVRISIVAPAGRFSVPAALASRPDFPGRAARPFFESCGSRLMSGFSGSRRPAVFRVLWLSPYVRISRAAPAGRFFESCGSRLMSGFSGSRRFGSCGARRMSGFSWSRRPADFRFLRLSLYVRIFRVAPAGRFSIPQASVARI
jgi:hypothetical protein